MSWRRYDDGYEDHPKVVALIDKAGPWAYYRLNKIHGYCARWNTYGHITRAAARELGVTKKMLDAMISVRLLDENPDGTLSVHHWEHYNPPATLEDLDRLVTEFLTANPDASANDVCKAIPAKRTAVLASVKRFHDGSQSGSEHGSQTGSWNQQGTGTRAGTGARSPSPSPSKTLSALRPGDAGDSPNGTPTTGERDDELTKLLDKLGASEGDRRTAAADPSRAIATARFTLAQPDVSRPLAYYRKITATGLYPEGAEHIAPGTPRPLAERLANLIRNTGRHDTKAGIRREIADEERRTGESLTDEQRLELHELWRSLQSTPIVKEL